jgi:RNA polymerase sigma-70 factor, ECF subfamily
MEQTSRLADICRRIRASDQEAFAELFAMLRNDLIHYVDSFIHDGPTAHDLVQDVFVGLWERRDGLDPSQSLQGLLYRMARNRALNHRRFLRVRNRHDVPLDEVRAPATGPSLDEADLAERLRAWIRLLPERQREAIELTRYGGLSHREAAAVMEISPRTLNNHLVRALGTLNARLAALEQDVQPGT